MVANETLDLSFERWKINQSYGNNLINVYPTKDPIESLWYRDNFYSKDGKSDRSVWFVGRNGFLRTHWLSRAESVNYVVTDVEMLDGSLYYLVKHDDIIELRVVCDTILQTQDCNQRVNVERMWNLCCDAWYVFEKYKVIQQYKTNPCMFDKFVRTKYVRDHIVTVPDVSIVNEIVGNTIQSYVQFNATDYDAPIVWDYIKIDYTEDGAAVWQIRTIVRIEWDRFYIDSPLLGMLNSVEEIQATWEATYTLEWVVSFWDNYDETLIFATGNGIRFIGGRNACNETDLTYYTGIYGNTNIERGADINYLANGFYTTKIFNYGGQIWYLSNTVNSFANFGLVWFNQWYFTALTSVDIPSWYTDVIEFNNVLVLSGTNKIWYIARKNSTNTITQLPDMSFVQMTTSFGHFNIWSFDEHIWDIYGVTNEWNFYSLGMEYKGYTSFGEVVYQIKPRNLWTFVQDELDKLNFWEWDKVRVKKYNDRISLFIYNDRAIDESVVNVSVDNYISDGGTWYGTKILTFNNDLQCWYQWIMPTLELYDEKYGLYYGKGMYINYSNDDDWEPIKQIVWAYFDIPRHITKKINNIKVTIGDKSRVTKHNTIMKAYATDSWWETVRENDERQDTDYVSMLANAENIENKNRIERMCDISKYGYHSIWRQERATYNHKEFDAFNEYASENNSKWVDKCWEYETNVEQLDYNNDKRKQDWQIRVGRYGVLWFRTDLIWDSMYVEYIAKWWDRIHTNGYMFFYTIPQKTENNNINNNLFL